MPANRARFREAGALLATIRYSPAPSALTFVPQHPQNFMALLDRFETRLGRFALPHFVRAIVFLNAVTWIALTINPAFRAAITLDPQRIMDGEVWRLVTFLFIPRSNSLFFVFYLLLLWMMGDALEDEWGALRVNLYYFIGMVGAIVAAFFFRADPTGVYLNLSVFLACATMFPEFQIVLFFVLPVRMKWLALLVAAWLAFNLALGPGSTRIAILISFANYLIFFGPMWWQRLRGAREIAGRQNRFASQKKELEREMPTLHRCAICGRTDETDPQPRFPRELDRRRGLLASSTCRKAARSNQRERIDRGDADFGCTEIRGQRGGQLDPAIGLLKRSSRAT